MNISLQLFNSNRLLLATTIWATLRITLVLKYLIEKANYGVGQYN
mgnify:CR=1 FL=1|jgi:hypothetical protein